MKNTIVVLIVQLLGMPVFAQNDAVKMPGPPPDNNAVYPRLNSFLRSEKDHYGFLYNTKQWDSKRFTELYDQYHYTGNQATQSRRITFMNGPKIFSSVAAETGSSSNYHYPLYSPGNMNPSTALELLGIVGGMVAGAIYPSYIGKTYHNNGAAVEAYLQSTYYQHNRQ